MKAFFVQRWFLVVLTAVLVVGIGGWRTFEPVADARWLRNGVVAGVLFLMALPLHAGAMGKVLRRPAAPLLGVAINFGLLPLTAWGVSWLLRPDTGAGLLVAATTPCTLASAIVWTRRAGGNDATAVLVTVFTNATCFFFTPLWLTATLGTQAKNVHFDLRDTAAKLAMLVVLPMVAAQLLRLHRPLAHWATQHGRRLSVLAQCGILTMVFVGAITTGEMLSRQSPEDAFSLLDWGAMIAAVLGVHLAMLWAGCFLALASGMTRGDRIAVGISGSQKTLMVGLQVALDNGLLVLPMIVYHVGQLLVDTIIADGWRRTGEKADHARAEAAARKT